MINCIRGTVQREFCRVVFFLFVCFLRCLNLVCLILSVGPIKDGKITDTQQERLVSLSVKQDQLQITNWRPITVWSVLTWRAQ